MAGSEVVVEEPEAGGGDEAGTAAESGVIALSEEEQELVAAELGAVIPALSGERRARYAALAAAVDAGEVPGELAPVLGGLLELALQTARARRLYSAEGERVLTGLFTRTPRGREIADQTRAVNRALRALNGAAVSRVSVRMRTVGHFSITLRTDAATITLGVRPDSVNVESVAVGEPGSDPA